MSHVAASTLSLSQLVALYNLGSEKQVKSFKDKPTAIARVEKLCTEQNVHIEADDDGFDLISNVVAQPVVEAAPAKAKGKRSKGPSATDLDRSAKGGRGAKPHFDDSMVITEIAVNPKRPTAKNFPRYATMTEGMRVGDFLAALVGVNGMDAATARRIGLGDLIWDVSHGFIKVG